jgi:hypothetical protein
VIYRSGLPGTRRRARTWQRAARCAGLAVLALAAGALGACGSTDSATRSASTTATTSPATTGTRSTADPDPGTIAVRFTQALFGGHFDRARRYVAPDSRNALLVITAGLRSDSLSQHDLAVGSSSVHGTSAATILTGTLCSSHGAKPVTRSSRDCITNRDPHSDDPMFRVVMTLGPARRWQVSYRLPRTAGRYGEDPAARTP